MESGNAASVKRQKVKHPGVPESSTSSSCATSKNEVAALEQQMPTNPNLASSTAPANGLHCQDDSDEDEHHDDEMTDVTPQLHDEEDWNQSCLECPDDATESSLALSHTAQETRQSRHAIEKETSVAAPGLCVDEKKAQVRNTIRSLLLAHRTGGRTKMLEAGSRPQRVLGAHLVLLQARDLDLARNGFADRVMQHCITNSIPCLKTSDWKVLSDGDDQCIERNLKAIMVRKLRSEWQVRMTDLFGALQDDSSCVDQEWVVVSQGKMTIIKEACATGTLTNLGEDNADYQVQKLTQQTKSHAENARKRRVPAATSIFEFLKSHKRPEPSKKQQTLPLNETAFADALESLNGDESMDQIESQLSKAHFVIVGVDRNVGKERKTARPRFVSEIERICKASGTACLHTYDISAISGILQHKFRSVIVRKIRPSWKETVEEALMALPLRDDRNDDLWSVVVPCCRGFEAETNHPGTAAGIVFAGSGSLLRPSDNNSFVANTASTLQSGGDAVLSSSGTKMELSAFLRAHLEYLAAEELEHETFADALWPFKLSEIPSIGSKLEGAFLCLAVATESESSGVDNSREGLLERCHKRKIPYLVAKLEAPAFLAIKEAVLKCLPDWQQRLNKVCRSILARQTSCVESDMNVDPSLTDLGTDFLLPSDDDGVERVECGPRGLECRAARTGALRLGRHATDDSSMNLSASCPLASTVGRDYLNSVDIEILQLEDEIQQLTAQLNAADAVEMGIDQAENEIRQYTALLEESVEAKEKVDHRLRSTSLKLTEIQNDLSSLRTGVAKYKELNRNQICALVSTEQRLRDCHAALVNLERRDIDFAGISDILVLAGKDVATNANRSMYT